MKFMGKNRFGLNWFALNKLRTSLSLLLQNGEKNILLKALFSEKPINYVGIYVLKNARHGDANLLNLVHSGGRTGFGRREHRFPGKDSGNTVTLCSKKGKQSAF